VIKLHHISFHFRNKSAVVAGFMHLVQANNIDGKVK